jgi:hypothetical protein
MRIKVKNASRMLRARIKRITANSFVLYRSTI